MLVPLLRPPSARVLLPLLAGVQSPASASVYLLQLAVALSVLRGRVRPAPAITPGTTCDAIENTLGPAPLHPATSDTVGEVVDCSPAHLMELTREAGPVVDWGQRTGRLASISTLTSTSTLSSGSGGEAEANDAADAPATIESSVLRLLAEGAQMVHKYHAENMRQPSPDTNAASMACHAQC